MPALSKKALFLAQLIKEAGRIESEKKLAKMLCYIEKERGIKTGFAFEDRKHGNYTPEIKEEKGNLQKEGLIEFIEERSTGVWGDALKKHIFVATPKLKNMDLPLAPGEKMAVHSVYREYSAYSPKEIEGYDHAVYRHGKVRTDVEMREESLKTTNKLVDKHKGNEKAALEEWLFG